MLALRCVFVIPADDSDGLDGPALRQLADRARQDDAVAARRRRADLVDRSADDASVEGVLLDAAEANRPVDVYSAGGVFLAATVLGVGVDVVSIASGERGEAPRWVRVGAVVGVVERAGSATFPRAGDRRVDRDVRFVDVVADLAAERVEVDVRGANGERWSGVFEAVGREVAALRLTGQPARRCYVRVSSLVEVALRSG